MSNTHTHTHHSLWSRITCCQIGPRNPLRLWYLSITEGLTASKYSTFWSLRDSTGIYLFKFSGVQTGLNGSAKTTSPPNLGLDHRSSPPWPVNLWSNFGQVHMGSGSDLSLGLDGGSTTTDPVSTILHHISCLLPVIPPHHNTFGPSFRRTPSWPIQ